MISHNTPEFKDTRKATGKGDNRGKSTEPFMSLISKCGASELSNHTAHFSSPISLMKCKMDN